MMTIKVMLIEDDNTMLTLLGTLLRFEGFEIAQLDNDDHPDDILQAMRLEQPDAVLLDVHLRQFNGFDLLHRIRQEVDMRNTRVIMSSGMDFSTRCLKEGADGFLLKPYMPEDLIDEIRRVMGK
jgi:DNA-binding response OmpR family regulator